MGKKVLALLLAVLTVGQSFSLTSFAVSDSNAQQSSTVSGESAVKISSSGSTKTFDIKLTKDDIQRLSSKEYLSSVSQAVYADGKNLNAIDLTKGYTLDSEKFDLRNVNGKSYTTPVRAQAPFGTCWSFATIAALESSILGAGLNGADGKKADTKTLDLSEKQIAWFSAMPLKDPSNPQNGEGQFIGGDLSDPKSLTSFMNRGGNSTFSEYALMQGIGPSHESSAEEFEYHGKEKTVVSRWMDGSMQKYSYSDTDDWSSSNDLRYVSDYSVTESHNLPKTGNVDEYGYYTYHPEGTEAIKQELLNLRGVQVSFWADTSMPGQEGDGHYLSSDWAHYTYVATGTNHAVTIVGWDDNYPKENFIEGSLEMVMRDGKTVTIDKQPPANGAWLVKNSWGSAENEFPNKAAGSWGIEENGKHTGYFWLSYYDKSLAVSNPVSFVVQEDDTTINNIDQHDYMPVVNAVSGRFDDKRIMANRFYAKHNEILRQVMCYTSEPNVEVTYEIYLLDDFADKPVEGIKVAAKTIKYAYKGFHKENVSDFDILFDVSGDGSNDIRISQYQEYSIAVTQKAEDGKYLVNFPLASDSESGDASFKGIINRQESYVYYDDYWNDYKDDTDLRQEMLKQILDGQEPPIDANTYDNFPIKGFTQVLENDTIFNITNNGTVYYGTKEHNSNTMRLVIHSSGDGIPSFGESDVTWGIMPFDHDKQDVYLTGERISGDPTRYTVTAKKADEDTTRVYITIKGIGTVSTHVSTWTRAFLYIDFPFNGTGDVRVFPYTGSEVKPCTGVSGPIEVEPFIEGEDFELTYRDNIKCGLAKVDAKPMGDNVSPASFGKETFVIVPAKPVIKNAKADGSKLVVEVEDQSESNPSGYRLQYRVKGETEWQETLSKGTSPIVIAYGVDAGRTYEVRVSGYTEIPMDREDRWYGDLINYGEASEISEIKTQTISPIVRTAGNNRFGTAAEIAKDSFVHADTVVLAYGMDYADALAGVSLAKKLSAPILLTNTDSLPRETTNTIEMLGAKNVVILGGEGVVSNNVEKTLKEQGLTTKRIAGKTRFATAVEIAKQISDTPEDIFFVYAQNYADALSVSSPAAIKGAPVVYLTTDGELNADTAAYLAELKEEECVKNAYVIGGEGVISDDMMNKAAQALGLEKAERIAGNNRYQTCIAVNEKFKDVLTSDTVCIATGKDFPDALAGGVFAALYKAPLVLVADKLTEEQTQYIGAKKAMRFITFGGKSVVPDDVMAAAYRAGK